MVIVSQRKISNTRLDLHSSVLVTSLWSSDTKQVDCRNLKPFYRSPENLRKTREEMATEFEMIFYGTKKNAFLDYSELASTAPLQVSPAAVPAFALLKHFTTILEERAII